MFININSNIPNYLQKGIRGLHEELIQRTKSHLTMKFEKKLFYVRISIGSLNQIVKLNCLIIIILY